MARTTSRMIAYLMVLFLGPGAVWAQATDPLREAGNEVRFRVVQRFSKPAPDSLPAALTSLLDSERYKAADAYLQKNSVSHPDIAFLTGYVAFMAQDFPRAHQLLANSAGTSGVLEEYAWFYAAKSAFMAKDYEQGATMAARVRSNPLLRPEAIWIMAQSLDEAKKPDDAIRAMRGLVASFPKSRYAAQARMKLAQSYRSDGRWNDAAREWIAVRSRSPLSSNGAEASKALAEFNSKFSPQLRREALVGPQVILSLYRAKFGAHRSQQVVDELPGLIGDWKPKSEEWCEAHYLVGRSYSKLRKHGDSTGWYAKVIAQCVSQPNIRRKALYNGGQGRWNAGDRKGALAWFDQLQRDYSAHSYADDALYFSARILLEDGREKDAKTVLEKQIKRYPTGDMAKDSHWLIVRNLLAKKRYKEVIAYIDTANVIEGDVYSQGRMQYFRARAIELSKSGDAEAAYVKVATEAPLSYYALLALNRIAQKKGTTDLCKTTPALCRFQTLKGAIPEIPDAVKNSGGFVRGMALVKLHLDTLARRELKALGHLGDTEDGLWAIADALDHAGAYPLSHDIPRRQIEDWETGYPDPNGLRKWEIAYPMPFESDVVTWSKKRGIAPALAYAIMREESGFSPGIESWANARGLMQMMKTTGSRMAKSDGLSGFQVDDLFKPSTSIRLGTLYLSELGGNFSGHPALTIAGYNGGAANVRKWLKEAASSDLDLFVEDIPFGQTRKYTKRVLRTFWIYEYLRGHQVPWVPPMLPASE